MPGPDFGTHIKGMCAPGDPNCGSELLPGGAAETVGLARPGWPDGTPNGTNVKCPAGQTSCDPES
jgi:hypothetical protein